MAWQVARVAEAAAREATELREEAERDIIKKVEANKDLLEKLRMRSAGARAEDRPQGVSPLEAESCALAVAKAHNSILKGNSPTQKPGRHRPAGRW